MRSLCVDLAGALRDEVRPELGSHAAKAHAGSAEGGDVTFAIDERAETRMESFLAERAPEVAFYSEDRGMVHPSGGDAEWVLIVDPIDGTRPAAAGLESCCVSIAAARLDGEPTIDDVEVGVILELMSGEAFVADPRRRDRARRRALAEHGDLDGCSGPTASAAARPGR